MDTVYSLADASEILPMWVADMDFAAPQQIIDALHQRLEHPFLDIPMFVTNVKNPLFPGLKNVITGRLIHRQFYLIRGCTGYCQHSRNLY